MLKSKRTTSDGHAGASKGATRSGPMGSAGGAGEPMRPVPGRPAPPQLATMERLGNTAVATITVTELSGADAMALMADLMGHVEGAGVKHFVFDLQNVSYMDSSCVGAMVELLTRLQRSGGRIALVNAAQSVEYLFRLTRLDRLFPICRDVPMAINAVERAETVQPKR